MKVNLCLSALTRVEYSREVEVPDGSTDEELEKLVEDLYSEVDGGDYYDDVCYWEKGSCYFEKAEVEA